MDTNAHIGAFVRMFNFFISSTTIKSTKTTFKHETESYISQSWIKASNVC